MRRAELLLLASFGLAVGAAAQVPSISRQGGIRQVIVYGTDPCPRSGDEIVVCARRPNADRYRIPEELRTTPNNPNADSWALRAEAIEYVGAGGTQSCSPVGPGGATGCLQQFISQARRERTATDTNGDGEPDPRP